MKIFATLLIVGVFGALGRRTDIDINRVKQISNQVPLEKLQENTILRSNDYDDHSSWYQRAPVPPTYAAETSKTPVKVHQPREDPRLYYQSDAYLNEHVREKVNEEVTFVYPGRDVVRAGERAELSRIRSKDVDSFAAQAHDVSICVKCPHDLTLVAKASSGRVVLQSPTLRACSGRKASRNARFVHMYGPKIGSLLEQGSHMIVGRIMYKNKNLQLCKMQVHVVTQGCVTPKHLVAHCWDQNKQCNFTCANKHLELSGPTTQVCGDGLRWKGDLPVCKAKTWCEFPPPPERGRVSCQGATVGNGKGLAEGSRCRVKCMRGFRSTRVTPVCRRGSWTHALTCGLIRKRNIKQS
ncbi:uncharacterized protein LOC125225397 [Leguminivora glycinivorella]|uniref:uncharacterized protein LOC125225397 n=1 Tax=Leguminivora glycinivorella TaxID=1035111 RepID=UPI0020104598|nr:uncharacterized protein LOC125225397 [Leguminivora glycinivorella]